MEGFDKQIQAEGLTPASIQDALDTSAGSDFLNGIKGRLLVGAMRAIARQAVNDNTLTNPLTGRAFTTDDLDAMKDAA